VHPDHQKAGLGGALLLEGLSRLGELGATSALVNFYGGDDAANATYEGAGFRRIYTAPILAISVSP
jgi:ribosomal protein S18 acetylase RimI-like enzyme